MKINQKKIKQGLNIVSQIQKVRSKNNKSWMDLLKLSLKLDYEATSKILNQICKYDIKISNLAKKIYQLKKKN